MLCGLLLLSLLFAPLASTAADEPEYKTTKSMREDTRKLVKYLEKVHYSGNSVQEIDSDEFITTYMSSLDAQRIFFLEKNRYDFQKRFGNMLDIYLRQGTLMPAFEIFKTYRKRANARIEWILKRLEEDFSFGSPKQYTTDRSEADWPANETEADQLWEKRLKHQLIIEMLGKSPIEADKALPPGESSHSGRKESSSSNTAAKKKNNDDSSPLEHLKVAKETLRKRYKQMQKNIKQIDSEEIQETYLTALSHMYDPHSTYMSANTLEDFAIQMNNSLVGIGAVLSYEDGYCTIKKLIAGGPADTSNELEPEDRIVGVAQGEEEMVDVIGRKLRDTVEMIRGEKGTNVRLLIQPANADPSEREEIVLERDKIKLTASLAQAEIYQMPANKKNYDIGVIELPAFYGSNDKERPNTSTDDVAELIDKLKKAGMDGLVLDLRRNGGGLLSEAVNLAGLFIPTGPVVQVKSTVGRIQKREDRNEQVAWDGPLILLTSRLSASASEIVAGALRNHRRALVVGDSTTHGKGTVQAVFEMDNANRGFFNSNDTQRGAAKVTIQKWYLPNGKSTQIKGVPSDIQIPSMREFLPIGEDDLPHAMVWDEIEPIPNIRSKKYDNNYSNLNKYLLTDELTKELKKSSKWRQNNLKEFEFWNHMIGWFEQKKEQKSFSLNLEKRMKRREKEDKVRDNFDDTEKKFAKDKYPQEEVLLDISIEKQKKSEQAHSDNAKNEDTEDTDTQDDEEAELDIHLRESLRIMTDWLQLVANDYEIQLAHAEQKNARDSSSSSRNKTRGTDAMK